MKLSVFTILLVSITDSLYGAYAEQCGGQAGGALCPGSGNSPPSPSGGGVASIISAEQFDQLLMHRGDSACPAQGFYRYSDFILAVDSFPSFGTTGDLDTQKREIAAFLAQTSHETSGGWADAPDGPYAWGYCFLEEPKPFQHFYCVPSVEWPCVPGKKYYGRGPMLLTYNYYYGPAGEALGLDLLGNPELVVTNGTISFQTALWFWMTPQSPKPSCHDVITDNWTPSLFDKLFGRFPGYGAITNIINGGLECGHGPDSRVADRIGFYERFCDILGVNVGANMDCYNQGPFDYSAQVSATAVE